MRAVNRIGNATLLGIAAACLSACTGPTGMTGPRGPQGDAGEPGPRGPALIVSDRAKAGLDASPVALALDGLTAAQAEMIGRGSYLVNAAGDCNGCHGLPGAAPKFLAGGTPFPLDGQGHLVYARNLTPDANSGLKLSEDQFVEAMRTGKDFASSGQLLLAMPWPNYRWMSTEDLKAIYAYLKAIPAVSNAVTADAKGPFAAAMPVPFPTSYNEGEVSPPPSLPPEVDAQGGPIPDPDAVLRGLALQPLAPPASFKLLPLETQMKYARGSYLVNSIGACSACHSNPSRDLTPGPTFLKLNAAGFLAGGTVFPAPPGAAPSLHVTRSMSADLIGETNGFFNEPLVDFALFLGVITEGLHLDDQNPKPLAWPMPFDHLRRMTLYDLESVYVYVKSLASSSPRLGGNDKLTQMAARFCTMDKDCNTAGGESCSSATNECIGTACIADNMCGACQSCVRGRCGAPATTSLCLTQGLPGPN